MGVLGQSKDQGAGAVTAPLQGPVDRTGFFQNVGAGFTEAKAGPHSTRVGRAIYETRAYDRIVQALTAEGEQGVDYVPSPVKRDSPFYRPVAGEQVNANGVVYIPVKRAFRNPYASAKNPIQGLYLGGDLDEIEALWAAIQRVRQRKPGFLKDLPDQAALQAYATAQRNRDLKAAQTVTERASGLGTVGRFIGGMVGSLASGDPENFVGGGFGTAAGKTVARTIIRRGAEGAAANATGAIVGVPGQMADAQQLGQDMTAGDAAHQVLESAGIGFGLGVSHVVVPKVARKGAQAVGAAADRITALPPVRDALIAASIRAGTISDHAAIGEWADAHQPGGAVDTSTPDERAAAHVVVRDAANREFSPLEPEHAPANEHRLDAVAQSLGIDLSAPEVPSAATIQTATVRDRSDANNSAVFRRPVKGRSYSAEDAIQELGMTAEEAQHFVKSGRDDRPEPRLQTPQPARSDKPSRRPSSYEAAVHQAEGTGKNPDSSANGHFQFIESTWLEYAPRVTNTAGMSRAQILALRHDRGIATRAEQLFRGDNARYLRSHGVEDSPGNLSLAHFLGKADAAKVLRAAPDTPIEQLVNGASIRANHNVFKKIRTADDMIRWGHKRIGAAVDAPVARADAVPEADGLDEADYSETPYERATFRPDEVETDAALMQYKSGGDENGVTGKLRDVTAWDPIMSSEILAWEGMDGRRVVVDGHQRVGLAKRLASEGQDIELPALIVREADGISAAQARVLGALRNINLGTGSLLDNARVLRDAPQAAEIIKGAEHRREIEGLSRLSYDAFGAAINDVIDPRIAAEIGKYAGDRPETHMALVGLLARERVSNPGEAGVIVRQALADGFGAAEEHQLGMFDDAAVSSLYVPIARILKAAASRLRDEKRTFRTLAEKSGRIEEAGNVLDKAANEERVIGSDEALAILNATAHSAGPVRDALIAAARAELSGSRRGDAVNQFLDALAGIDLRSAAGGASEHGPLGQSLGEAGGRDAAAEADRILSESDGPSLFDHAVSSKAEAEPFSEPAGAGAKAQTDLLEHDLRADADPAIAERQRQEGALKAASPMRSTEEQEGTMGLGLFDVADQPTFRLSDEGDAQSLGSILDEADADEAAAQALRACLK